MSAMIPHYLMTITRSERAEITDVRVCELAAQISEAQRREIDEMEWLINAIEQNGEAATAEEAEAPPHSRVRVGCGARLPDGMTRSGSEVPILLGAPDGHPQAPAGSTGDG